jgi:hypothetical protein
MLRNNNRQVCFWRHRRILTVRMTVAIGQPTYKMLTKEWRKSRLNVRHSHAGRRMVPSEVDPADLPPELQLAEVREAIQIARDHIDFDVDAIAHPKLAERRDRKRVRNDVDRKTASFDVIDGQTYAVNAD